MARTPRDRRTGIGGSDPGHVADRRSRRPHARGHAHARGRRDHPRGGPRTPVRRSRRRRLRRPAGRALPRLRRALGRGRARIGHRREPRHRGPYQPSENPFLLAFVPLPGYSARRDATYFPIPWLLSSRGAGLLVRDDTPSTFRLGRPWGVEVDGAPRLRAPEIHEGAREIDVQAPADEIPLFVRAGAMLTLLPADVRTLSDYGAGKTVRLADRAHRRTILAWRPALRIRQERRRRLDVQLAIARRPRCLNIGRRRVRFSYSGGILRASVKLRNGTIRARQSRLVCSTRVPINA